ncbi:MAG TPA: methylated-DNA--[protein]-cysteine S-methyltransferase [Ferruginibacter sp.]|nr:methylated-DNA--[protein]-cysteine S-methyltransferase [Ferruginibacter sp.]
MSMKETVFYNSPVGYLKLTAEQDALTEVLFVKKDDEEKILENKAPSSSILQQTIQQLNDYFSGKNISFNLPIQQNGTAFQQKVWKALQNIKSGTTISYLELSKQLGDVKAIRAVGTANGKNNIAIIVPCHRVIGSNGNLVGYAGELWRKKWLLEHEAKYCNGVQSLFE